MPGLGLGLGLNKRRGNLQFSPLVLSPSLWLDFSDASTLYTDSSRTTLVASDGDVIGGVTDKSGSGKHFTQTDGTAKGLYKTNQQNGKSCIRFDGVNDYLSNASFALSQPFSVFLVMKIFAVGNFLKSAGPPQLRTGLSGSITPLTSATIAAGSAYNVNSYFVSGTCLLVNYVFNGASSKIYKNGSLFSGGTGNAGSGAMSGALYLASYDGSTGTQMDAMELVITSSELSTGNLTLLNTYFVNKWGYS